MRSIDKHACTKIVFHYINLDLSLEVMTRVCVQEEKKSNNNKETRLRFG